MIPQISAYMSSIRPNQWMRIHKMLGKSNLSFEMVIVGPSEPDFTLPKEIRFFKSNVKPSQCFHAAATLSSGETLLQMVDDIEYSDGAIKEMYDIVVSNDNAMATCQYFKNGYNNAPFQNIAGNIDNLIQLPLLPVCGLYPRSAYAAVGGIDKRFDGIMGELDLYMRMRINGYLTVFVNHICNENTSAQEKENSSLCKKFWPVDRPKLLNLWTTNGILLPVRNDIVRRFNDENILTIDQNHA